MDKQAVCDVPHLSPNDRWRYVPALPWPLEDKRHRQWMDGIQIPVLNLDSCLVLFLEHIVNIYIKLVIIIFFVVNFVTLLPLIITELVTMRNIDSFCVIKKNNFCNVFQITFSTQVTYILDTVHSCYHLSFICFCFFCLFCH